MTYIEFIAKNQLTIFKVFSMKIQGSKIVKFCLRISVQAQTGKMMSHKRCATTFNFFLGKLQGDKLMCAIITPIILRASRTDEMSVHVFSFRSD